MISVRTKLYFSMENLILQQFFVFTFSERHDKMCSYLYFSFLRGQTMDSNFFALISRMRYIARWGLMRNALPENIQEHSHMVAVLAHALALIERDILGGTADPDRCATAALFHDASEILTGDLPTPVKYKNESIKTAYKAVEKEAQTALLSRLPVLMAEEMTPWFTPTEEYRPYIKAADKLSALIKCTEERRAGNHEFDRAYDTLLQAIHEMELPEAEQFMMQFLPPFGMTLDDL